MEKVHASQRLADLIGDAEAVKPRNTKVIQAELRREAHSETCRRAPVDGGANVVRCVMEAEGVAVAQAAVHLDTGNEFLCAEDALPGAGCQFEGTAGGNRIAKLPGAVGQVLLKNQILAEVPALVVAAQDQLQLDFALSFLAGNGIAIGKVGNAIMTNNLEEALVGAVDVFELDIQHGIDPMLAGQGTKAIFPAKSGEDGAVSGRGYTVEVSFSGPPGLGAVFELHRGAAKPVSQRGRTYGALDGNFKVAWLLHIVRIGHEVRPFLGEGGSTQGQQQQGENVPARAPSAICGRIVLRVFQKCLLHALFESHGLKPIFCRAFTALPPCRALSKITNSPGRGA